MSNITLDSPATYQIKVAGYLDQKWSDWFNGMEISHALEGDNTPITTLTGPVTDQPSLRGILSKIWDLNLVLISLFRISGPQTKNANLGNHS